MQGWAEATEMDAIDLARRFEDAGVAAIIYTDIDRDGVLAGLNIEATLALARAVSIPVIASGGLASLADVAACSGRTARSSKAPSPAARSTTAGWTRPRRCSSSAATGPTPLPEMIRVRAGSRELQPVTHTTSAEADKCSPQLVCRFGRGAAIMTVAFCQPDI